MHVYRHFQCSDFIHIDECVQNETKNKSDEYKRQGEVHRVSRFMHEDNYDTTLRKAVAPLLDKAANYNKCHLVMAGGRVSNLPLLSKQRPWSLGGFMEELGGFEKGKRLVIGVYVPNDVSSPAYMVLNIPRHMYIPSFSKGHHYN